MFAVSLFVKLYLNTPSTAGCGKEVCAGDMDVPLAEAGKLELGALKRPCRSSLITPSSIKLIQPLSPRPARLAILFTGAVLCQ